MEKLTYQKYKGSDNILTIDLHNGYTVIAIKSWNKEKNNYIVELRLKENSIEKWDLIEKAENLEFDVTYKIINRAILSQIATFLEDGFFDYYIQRNEYELNCFGRGHELFENESMGDA